MFPQSLCNHHNLKCHQPPTPTHISHCIVWQWKPSFHICDLHSSLASPDRSDMYRTSIRSMPLFLPYTTHFASTNLSQFPVVVYDFNQFRLIADPHPGPGRHYNFYFSRMPGDLLIFEKIRMSSLFDAFYGQLNFMRIVIM